jgi:aryl-alcohol dehydrogenase-like predicted oxidoreductase
MVGAVLKGRPRDQFVVTTKVCESVGKGPNDRGLSRGHILREIDNSLTRLQMDYVDIYLPHHPDPTTPIEETLDALNDVVQQGKLRYVGCDFSAWQVCKAHRVSETPRPQCGASWRKYSHNAFRFA